MHALARLAPRGRQRVALIAALVVAVIAGLWTFASTRASAHWPIPQVDAKCATDGGWAVSFNVESWKKSDRGGGGNPHVEVAYQVDNGAWVTLPWKANYSFTSQNNFQFGDFFNVPAGNASKVRVKVWTTAKWSDGYKNADPKYSNWTSLPKNCAPKTTTTKKPTTTTTKRPTTTTTICEEPTTTTTKPTTTTTEKPTTTTTKPTTTTTEKPTTTTTKKPTTTTTKKSTTTTEKPTTTTTKPTTTTTEKPTTTTTEQPTTTVQVSPTTLTPSTAPPTVPPTQPAPPVTVAVKPSSPLPVTGLQTPGMLMLAAGLMAGGFLLIRAARAQG